MSLVIEFLSLFPDPLLSHHRQASSLSEAVKQWLSSVGANVQAMSTLMRSVSAVSTERAKSSQWNTAEWQSHPGYALPQVSSLSSSSSSSSLVIAYAMLQFCDRLASALLC